MYGNGLALMLGAGTLATLLIADPVSIAIGPGVLVVVGVAVATYRVVVVRRGRGAGAMPTWTGGRR